MFRNRKIIENVDILVIGAGSAGCMAAIGAAISSKHNVLLVERYGFFGGTSTQMLDTFYGFFTPGENPKKIVGGLPDTVVNELNKHGEIFLRPNTYGAGTGVNYNPERLKNVWDTLLFRAGVDVLLHTTLIDVQSTPDGRYECIFWNKSGFWSITPRRVIDASGDADFCHLAGFDYEIAGEQEPAQSLTTTFRMANVELEEYEKAGGKKMLAQHMADTSMPLPRKEGSAHAMNIPRCISTVAVKVSGLNALNINELTQAEIEGRKQAFLFESFFRKEVPGYADAKIIGLSHQIGVRETRRVYGEHRLTKEECMSAQIPDDSILLCGAPIEDHREGKNGASETHWEYIPKNGIYGVPYGTIVPKGSQTVWVVGRCFSATHDAHASCRSMAQTMSMGTAAGLAAGLSLAHDFSATALDLSLLREELFKGGGILEVPDKKASTGKEDWTLNVNSHVFH
ncbi:FAD-dependent oxidoreductase [Arundinibacter roseus]|uniref:FAD-dependent oxidoreductase n=1 Tax=Arundinibacter roseus TaxID=2070510 RepID=A0A4V2XAH4_9BACT|nr:FAD-dependent oxidoreductase [Arundinibacter roseus]TDB67375.1 FAD-dependent oxidoreductase [Arundinibacter roseus]